jgi:choice-of-anchor A domain-containing protein/RHS repeat-associated protein
MSRQDFWGVLDRSLVSKVVRVNAARKRWEGAAAGRVKRWFARAKSGLATWKTSAFSIENLEQRQLMTASPFEFSELVFGNDTRSYTDVQGRVAVGGTGTFTGFSVGTSLTDSDGTRDDLIVGGNLSYTNGQVFNGNVRSGGTATLSSWGHPNGGYIAGNPLDFTDLKAQAVGTSSYLAGLSATNSSAFQYGTLTLTGTKSVSVINVSGSQLATANSINLSAPSGGILVINVSGTADKMQYAGMNLSGTTNANVIWNFYEATTLTIAGIGVKGTVLAPSATVSFSNGNIDGSLIANNVSGSGEIHYHLYAGPQGEASVFNPVPVITGAPSGGTSPEGTLVSLGSTVSEQNYSGSFTYAWSVTKNGNAYSTGTASGFTFTPNDNGTYVVSLIATDTAGRTGSTSTTVNVANVTPGASISGSASGNEGTAVTYSSSKSDAGSADTHTYAWSVLKGGSPFSLPGGTVTNLSGFTFTPSDDGAYTVVLTVTDDDGGSVTTTAALTVANVVRTPSISGASSVNEGSAYTLNLTPGSDPGADSVTGWTINWGDGNTQTVTGNPPSVTHVYADGDDSYEISASVSDEDGEYDANTVTVSVDNVAPTVVVWGAASVNEGSAYTLNLSAAGDAGQDTVSGWVIDWGDGNTQTVTGNVTSLTHTYLEGPASVVVKAWATDEDGTYVSNTLNVNVLNVAPTGGITGAPSGSIEVGAAVNLGSTKTDPGSLDTFTYAWTLTKDGVAYNPGSGVDLDEATLDWTPSSTGSYVITLVVSDDDGGESLPASVTVDVYATLGVSLTLPSGQRNEGSEISVGSTVSGSATGTITYAWTITRNGSAYTAPEETVLNASTLAWTPQDNGVYGVTLSVTRQSLTATASGYVVVDNVAPEAEIIGAPEESPEGTPISVTSQVSDAGSADTFTYAWSVLKGGQAYALPGEAVTDEDAFEFTPDDDGLYTIVLTVTDDDGGTTTVSETVEVTNVAPAVVISGAASINEGATYTLSLSAGSDPGEDNITGWEINWGDGVVETITGNPSSVTHLYADGDADYQISATVTDEDGEYESNTIDVRVENVAPEAVISGAASINEGATYTLGLSVGNEPGADTVSQWVIDWGDGTVDTITGNASSVTHVYADGDADYQISATVSDEDGEYESNTVDVSVVNVAPGVSISGPSVVAEGATYTLNLSGSGDPGTDTISQWVVDWGDGVVETITGNPSSATHVYADGNADYQISAIVTDEDGEYESNTVDVSVMNVAPTVTLDADSTVDANQPYTLTLTAAGDPGTDTLTHWTINWGDGGAAQAVTATGNTLTITHTYTTAGTNTISASATDEDGTYEGQALEVDVLPAAPGSYVLVEHTRFITEHRYTLTMPVGMEALSLGYEALGFDSSSAGRINDAFEVALVDAQGRPLVAMVQGSRDAFANLTQGQGVAAGASALVDTVNGKVVVDVRGIAPGTQVTLVARLVNNDADNETTVTLDPDVEWLLTSPISAPSTTVAPAWDAPSTTVDYSLLSDVTGVFGAAYRQTSFNDKTRVLYAGLTLTNTGEYAVRPSGGARLLVAVKGISDPTVTVFNPDGYLPDGTPYLDITGLAFSGAGDDLNPGEAVNGIDLRFTNPGNNRFSYELQVLGHVNEGPAFVSVPEMGTELTSAVLPGRAFSYSAAATDPDGDALTYVLLAGPEGLSINAATGLVSWDVPGVAAGAEGDARGSHSVVIRATDAYGAVTTQAFTVYVGDSSNRPPVIVSAPVVEASVNTKYSYVTLARDADGDALSYALDSASLALGLVINPETGGITWTPGSEDLGIHTVSITVDDGNGGVAVQTYKINVQQAAGNHAPVVLSVPEGTAKVGTVFRGTVRGLDPDGDVVKYALAEGSASDLSINAETGELSWRVGAEDVGTRTVAVVLTDGRGGVTQKQFTLAAISQTSKADLTATDMGTDSVTSDAASLKISGFVDVRVANKGAVDVSGGFEVMVFHDINANGLFDAGSETLLGSVRVDGGLAKDASIDVQVVVAGKLTFAGAPLRAFVDSREEVAESSEMNNTLGSNFKAGYVPVVGEFNPVVEWANTTYTEYPTSQQVMMTPVVADLTGDGVPEIIYTTAGSATSEYAHDSVIRAVDGRTGESVWNTGRLTFYTYYLGQAYPYDLEPFYTTTPAVGDIDGDGKNEVIVTYGYNQDDSEQDPTFIVCLNFDGTFRWKADYNFYPSMHHGGAALADLDHDGKSEIVIGSQVYNYDGSLRWGKYYGQGSSNGTYGSGANWWDAPLSIVADLDLDGTPEIIAGRSVFRADGTEWWAAATSDSYTAVGQFDEDPYPEIVSVSRQAAAPYRSVVNLFNHDGTIVWQNKLLPDTAVIQGGPPLVADVDGDGKLEIGVAGRNYYTVFNDDGTVLWYRTIFDNSAFTGSTAFDFEGDGKAEIVYNDQEYLWIYNGADGTVLSKIPNSSGTAAEYPVVADVDADGNAEIVVGANSIGPYAEYNYGLFVYGDANDTWAPTRRIWNQASYHVTNVGEDGSIPLYESPSWLENNSYRANLQNYDGFVAAPDLVPSYLRSSAVEAGVQLTVRLGNAGSYFAPPGVFVAFYDGAPSSGGSLLGVVKSSGALEAGEYVDLTLSVSSGVDVSKVWIVADKDAAGDWAVREANEDNNTLEAFQGAVSGVVANLAGGGYRGATVYLDTNNNKVLDDGEMRTLTDASGGYVFYGLSAGLKHVRLVTPSGWTSVNPASGGEDVILSNAAPAKQVRFVVTEPAATPGVVLSPVWNSNTIPAATVREAWTYLADATDPADLGLSYKLAVAPIGAVIDPESGMIYWTPEPGTNVADQRFIVVVTNEYGVSATRDFAVTVSSANQAPLVVAQSVLSPAVGQAWEYLLRVVDPDGDELSFALIDGPEGLTLDTSTGLIQWTPEAGQDGEQTVVVEVSDGDGGLLSHTLALLVASVAGANHAPVINSALRNRLQIGQKWAYLVDASDPDADPLTYELVSGPAGMMLTDGHVLTWQPGVDQLGDNMLVVRVTDARGMSVDQTAVIKVTSQAENDAPQVVVPSGGVLPVAATVGTAFSYQVAATDPDGDTLIYRLLEAPEGVAIDTLTGVISWMPSISDKGVSRVVVGVQDILGGQTTAEIFVSVGSINVPPLIESIPSTVAGEGQAYAYHVKARDAEGQQVFYSLTEGPDGMSINPVTGVLSWTPGVGASLEGEAYVQVKATDALGGTAEQAYYIEVSASQVNFAPRITSLPVRRAITDEEYTYQLSAFDPEGQEMLFTLLSGPSGMALDAETGLLTWENPAAGEFDVRVAVYDEEGVGSYQNYRLTVATDGPPVMTVVAPASVTAGQSWRANVRGQDAEGDQVTLSLSGAPEGMTIDAYGRVTWQSPVTGAGTYTFNVLAEDESGHVNTYEMVLQVNPDVQVPNVDITPYGFLPAGRQVAVRLQATDNVGVASLRLMYGDQDLALDASGTAVITTPGWVVGGENSVILTYVVEDLAGNVSSGFRRLLLTGAADEVAPVVSITGPEPETAGQTPMVTGPVSISGTVEDENLAWYTLSYAKAGSAQFTVFKTGTESVASGVLGTFDPTLLSNGSYVIRLQAADDEGNVSTATTLVAVEGMLKLGNFSLSFDDMTVGNAFPITINRSYDTLNAGVQGDFGNGWSLNLPHVSIQSDVDPSGEYAFIGAYNGFYVGTRVYVTLPSGEKVGFTFSPVPVPPPAGTGIGGIFGANLLYGLTGLSRPSFTPDEGVDATLELSGAMQILIKPDGTFTTADGIPYNPASPLIDSAYATYTLTMKDGTRFQVNAQTGEMLPIKDLNGNAMEITRNGVTTSDAAGTVLSHVDFQRDMLGRITKITDEAGKSIVYGYDANGDLVSVTDRVEAVTQFKYEEPTREHFLTSIVNALGVTAMEVEFDEVTGRLAGIKDAGGNEVPFTYAVNLAPGLHAETVKDAYGNPTEQVYDAAGNVVRTIQRVTDSVDPALRTYLVTAYEYDSRRNQTKASQAFGVTGDANKYSQSPTVWASVQTYDGNRNVTSVTDALWNTSYFTYDVRGNVLQSVDAHGNVTSNTYDARGNMTRTIDVLGNATTYAYDNLGRLAQMIDVLGNLATVNYDGQSRVTSANDPSGVIRYIGYDGEGHQNSTSFTWVNPVNPSDTKLVNTSMAHNDEGWVVNSTDATGNSYTTVYNGAGQVVSTTNRFGGMSVNLYDARGLMVESRMSAVNGAGTSGWMVNRTSYDANGRAIYTTEAIFEIDPNGTVEPATGSRITYDALGRLVMTERVEGLVLDAVETDIPNVYTMTVDASELEVLTADYAYYDNAGRVVKTVSPTGSTSETVYNTLGQQLQVIADEDGNPLTTADRNVTTYVYDQYGRTKTVTDSLNRTTMFHYDELDRVRTTILPDGSATGAFEYDGFGRKISETDVMGRVTRYEYDNRGRQSVVELPSVPNPVTGEMVSLRYEYEYDQYGNQTAITDPMGHVTRFAFDEFGRQISRQLPAGVETTGNPDDYVEHTVYIQSGVLAGQAEYTVDFDGRVTSFVYDTSAESGGRLLEKRFYTSLTNYQNNPSTPAQYVKYTYTDEDQIDTVTQDADGNAATTADQRVEAYLYNARHQLITKSSPEGVIHYEYNDLGQQTRTYTTATLASSTVLTDTRYTFDNYGRMKTVESWASAGVTHAAPQITTYAYDLIGRLSEITYANGVTGVYAYDMLDRLDKLTQYLPDATPETLSDNVIAAEYDYTVALDGTRTALAEMVLRDANAGGGYAVSYYTWTYDNLNRLMSEVINSTEPGVTRTEHYAYDLAGNRIYKGDQAFETAEPGDADTTWSTYDANDRLITQRTYTAHHPAGVETTYIYSLSGESLAKTVEGDATQNETFTYDQQGRLVGHIKHGVTSAFAYDDSGIRVYSSQSDFNQNTATATLYLVDAMNPTGYAQILEERTATAAGATIPFVDVLFAVTKAYVLGMDVVQQWTPANTSTGLPQADNLVILPDGHGSTRLLLASATGVVASGLLVPGQRFFFDAWGNLLSPVDASTRLSSLLYAGEQRDLNSGMDYLRARYYNSELGRFISSDPWAGRYRSLSNFNGYIFAANNPILFIDLSGLSVSADTLSASAIQNKLAATNHGSLAQIQQHTSSAILAAAAGSSVTTAFALSFGLSALGPLIGKVAIFAAGKVARLTITLVSSAGKTLTSSIAFNPVSRNLAGRFVTPVLAWPSTLLKHPAIVTHMATFHSSILKSNMVNTLGLAKDSLRGFAAHHLIPIDFKTHRLFKMFPIDLDDAFNGILLSTGKGAHHAGNHPLYSEGVEMALDRIANAAAQKTPGPARDQFIGNSLRNLQLTAASALKEGADLWGTTNSKEAWNALFNWIP